MPVLNYNPGGHAHDKTLRVYFNSATHKNHIAHWWFRNQSGGNAIKPTDDYKNPKFSHTDGKDGKSIDTIMEFDKKANKYYIDIGPFTYEQRPEYVGHMVGPPAWTEESETQISYQSQLPEIIAEIDFSSLGGQKQKMTLTSGEDKIFHYQLSKTINNAPGTYKIYIMARSKDGTMKTRVPYVVSYQVAKPSKK